MARPGRNDTTRLILGRRSVRERYRDELVPRRLLEEIVHCALAAPSSKNARPWRLHVVSDRPLLAEISTVVATALGAATYVPRDPATGRMRPEWPSTVTQSAGVLASVPTAIFVENLGKFSGSRGRLASVPPDDLPNALFGFGLEMMGIGAAVMNMWLAANSLGLQAVFLGDICVAQDEIKAKLEIPGDLVGALAMGYSSEQPVPSSQPDDTERVVWHRP